MSSDLTITVVKLENDNQKVIDFLKENVQPLMSPKVYKWEYFFEEDQAIFVTANKKDEVVCTQSFLPYYLLKGGEKLKTSKSENSFLASEFRGTSLFKDVYDEGINACKAKNQKIVWGFTPAGKVWRKKLGFYVDEEASFDFRTVISPPTLFENDGFKSKVFLKAMFNIMLYFIYSLNRFAQLSPFSYKKELQKFEVRNEPINYEEIEGLHSSIFPSETISLLMNKAYLNWRIKENPALNYTTSFFYSEGRLVGYYIYSINLKLASNCAQLCELIAVNASVKKRITKHLLLALKKEPIVFMEYFGNLKNQFILSNFNWLKKSLGGRIIQNKNFSFVAKSLEPEPIIDSSNWYYNALWTEGFDR